MTKTTFEERAQRAETIGRLRQSLMLSQEQLARNANVSVSTVQKMERGVDGSQRMFDLLVSVMTLRKRKAKQ